MPGPGYASGGRVRRRGTSGGRTRSRDVAPYTPTRAVVAPSRSSGSSHRAATTRAYTRAYTMDEGLPYTTWGRGFYDRFALPQVAIPGARQEASSVLADLPSWLHRSHPRVKFAQPTMPGTDAYEQSWPKRGKRPVINLGDIPTILLDDRSHANQPERVLRDLRLREGMAELLSRKVAHEQYGATTPKSTYQPLVNELHRRYGPNVVRILRGMLG
jgi:hypothetical protein